MGIRGAAGEWLHRFRRRLCLYSSAIWRPHDRRCPARCGALARLLLDTPGPLRARRSAPRPLSPLRVARPQGRIPPPLPWQG